MSTSFDPSGNIEKYILAVEKKEKRIRIIKFSILVLLISSGFTFVNFFGPQAGLESSSYQKYFASELSFELVDSHFMNSQRPIIIKSKLDGRLDTIIGIEDYIQFELDASPEFLVVDDVQDEFMDDSSYDVVRSFSQSNSVALDIVGERTVGNKLSFQIIPLLGDSLPLYEIDFGNGLTKKVKSSIRYSYPQEGEYFVYVRTTDSNARILCKLPLQIIKEPSVVVNELSISEGQENMTQEEPLNDKLLKSSKSL